MKKIIIMLCLIFFTSSAYAVPNYSYTRVEDEQYSASSPVGHFVRYKEDGYGAQNYSQNVVYVNDNGFYDTQNIVYEPYPASVSDIYTPQSYNKRRVVSETMQDNRETADKVIDRTSRIAGTLGFLGLVTMGIIGIASAL